MRPCGPASTSSTASGSGSTARRRAVLPDPDAVEEVEAGPQGLIQRRLRDGAPNGLELGAQDLRAAAFAVLPVDVDEEGVPVVEGDGLQHASRVPNVTAGFGGNAAENCWYSGSAGAALAPPVAGPGRLSGAHHDPEGVVHPHDRQVDAAATRAHERARVARFAFRGTEAVSAVAADIVPPWHGPPFKAVVVVYRLTKDCPSGEHRVRGRWYTAHMAAESKRAVVAAIIGNAAIAVIKFIAGSITGSSAMISEGIHSLVDTGNGGLLYHGLRRSARPADSNHPFGHGMEVYFWSLIVAVSIFGIGGGMSIYEGIIHIQHPAPLENPTINYIVLALAAVFESLSFSVAWRAFRTTRGSRRTLSAIHHGKDPSLFTVLFEDTAALLGLGVAFVGVFLSHRLKEPVIDGAASIIIGGILVCAAVSSKRTVNRLGSLPWWMAESVRRDPRVVRKALQATLKESDSKTAARASTT